MRECLAPSLALGLPAARGTYLTNVFKARGIVFITIEFFSLDVSPVSRHACGPDCRLVAVGACVDTRTQASRWPAGLSLYTTYRVLLF